MADVCQPLKLLVKETTQKRQDHLKEVALQRAELDKHVATFDKVRRRPSVGHRGPFISFLQTETQTLFFHSAAPQSVRQGGKGGGKGQDSAEKVRGEPGAAEEGVWRWPWPGASSPFVFSFAVLCAFFSLMECAAASFPRVCQVEPARRDFAKKAIGREEAERVLDQVRADSAPAAAASPRLSVPPAADLSASSPSTCRS